MPRPISILNVDDEMAMCEMTKEFLEMSGRFTVDMVRSVAEARAALAQHQYDAIISDYQMPAETGIQFLISLRSSGDTTPFILFTGKGREEVVIEAFKNGADAYLQKGGEPTSLFTELEYRILSIIRRRRAELALLDSEEEYRSLFEASPDSIIIIDVNGRILNCNQSAAHMVLMDREEIIGTTVSNLGVFSDEDISLFKETIAIKAKGGTVSPVEAKVDRKDGTIRWVEIRSALLKKAGKHHAIQIIARDITERKMAEQAIRTSEGKFRAIFNEAAVGITTIGTDGKPLDFNDKLADYLGYTREELSKMTFMDLTAEDDRERNISLFKDLVAGKIDHFEIEKKYVRKDGKMVHARLYEKLVEAHDGEPPLILAIVADLTELKQAEEAWVENQARLQTLIQSIPDAIWLKDTEGRYIHCNSKLEQMFGAEVTDMIGKTDYDFVDRATADIFVENDQKAMGIGRPTINEEWITYKDTGERALFDTIKTPMYDSRGKCIGVLGIAHEITRRKMTEDSLLLMNRKLNLLSSMTRHDILNQILILKGQMSLILMRRPEMSSDEGFAKAERAADQISAIIEFTKVYEDIGVAAPLWHDVRKLVEECIAEVRPGQVAVIDDVPQGTLFFADPLVTKVFPNLVRNAIRHGKGVTRVRFYIDEQDGSPAVICEDDGSGIPDDIKAHLFNKGYGKDHGLGLFLCREILSITGITINEDGAPGKGARFVIRTPKDGFRKEDA